MFKKSLVIKKSRIVELKSAYASEYRLLSGKYHNAKLQNRFSVVSINML